MKPDINIMGNHDEILLDHGLIDKWPEDWRAYNQWAFNQIPPEIITMTKTYTFSGNYEIGDIEFFLHHGQLDRSIPPALPYADAASFEALDPENESDLILFGHNQLILLINWETRLISIWWHWPTEMWKNSCVLRGV